MISGNLIRIARILKSNGSDGELLISFRDFDPEGIDAKEPVFIKFDGLPVPFYFESFRLRGESRALVRLTGVHSLEDAEELAGMDVWFPEDMLESGEAEDNPQLLIGWMLQDENGNDLGRITAFEPIPGNPCLHVEGAAMEFMVPLNEELVLGFDSENSVLKMRVPEGLAGL